MEAERFLQLINDESELTDKELDEGWRFCAIEGTQLLIHPKHKPILNELMKEFMN